jgi:hypothetical protein
VPEGAVCKRAGCGARWAGEGESRGEGEGARCRHHPQPVSRGSCYDYSGYEVKCHR